MHPNKIYLYKNSEIFTFVGQPSYYFYDFGFNPLDSNTCEDILEQSRLIYAFYEMCSNANHIKENNKISSNIFKNLTEYFDVYKDDDFAYWSLLQYVSLYKQDLNNCSYRFDRETDNLILQIDDGELFVPYPYDNLVGEYENGEICEVDRSNYMYFETISYNCDDFPLLFMSNNQLQSNETELNNILKDIITILNLNNYELKNCRDLKDFYFSLQQ